MATRSSGMKKNICGNIKDVVVRIRMVTPQGTMERNIPVSQQCHISWPEKFGGKTGKVYSWTNAPPWWSKGMGVGGELVPPVQSIGAKA